MSHLAGNEDMIREYRAAVASRGAVVPKPAAKAKAEPKAAAHPGPAALEEELARDTEAHHQALRAASLLNHAGALGADVPFRYASQRIPPAVCPITGHDLA